MDREVFEKQLCNQSSQYEKYEKFSIIKRKPLCATTKSTLFAVGKDDRNTKEDTSTVSSLKMYRTYVLWYAKRAKAMSNSEKIKHIALA